MCTIYYILVSQFGLHWQADLCNTLWVYLSNTCPCYRLVLLPSSLQSVATACTEFAKCRCASQNFGLAPLFQCKNPCKYCILTNGWNAAPRKIRHAHCAHWKFFLACTRSHWVLPYSADWIYYQGFESCNTMLCFWKIPVRNPLLKLWVTVETSLHPLIVVFDLHSSEYKRQ